MLVAPLAVEFGKVRSTRNAVCMVLALHRHDKADYFRNHNDFPNAVNGGPR